MTNGESQSSGGFLEKIWLALDQNKVISRQMLIALYILATTIILPRGGITEYQFDIGKTWEDQDLVAPFDFSIEKSDAEYESDRKMALQTCWEIFNESQDSVRSHREIIIRTFEELRQLEIQINQNQITTSQLTERLTQLSYTLPVQDFQALIKSPRSDENLESLRNSTLKIFDRIYQHGLINKQKNTIPDPFLSFRKRDTYEIIVKKDAVWDMAQVQTYINQECARMPGESAKLAKEILIKLCKPNYIANETLHQQEKEAILNSVSKFYGKVKKNEVIILKGQTITRDIADKIKSLVKTKKQTEGNYSSWLRFLGQLMMITLVTFIFVLFLRINRKEIFFRNRKLSFLLILHFFMTVVIVTVMQIGEHIKSDFDVNYHLIVPVCMVPIVITIFFDDRIGFVSNVIVGVVAAYVTPNSFEFFFIQVCAGSVAVYNLTVLRNRSQFFETVGLVFVTYCIAYLSYNFFVKGNIEALNYRNLAMFLINVLFTMATYPLIYFFEKLFGFSSDLTYIELLDTNHPILKELAMKAPGTFQHSLQVANLAEAATNKIDGHGLLVRVGAMFHDIGKIYQPQYFTENQKGHNAHDELNPLQSAEIIINHVPLGVELAKQYNLPGEIIDFIKTHHGNSRVEAFYRKHLANAPGDDSDGLFRYRGPLPSSKEQAVLMIADSCEAASRSLVNPTEQDLEQLIEKIITYKVNDNQLAHARITFRDLNKIKAEILKILINIYHTRTKYPGDEKKKEDSTKEIIK